MQKKRMKGEIVLLVKESLLVLALFPLNNALLSHRKKQPKTPTGKFQVGSEVNEEKRVEAQPTVNRQHARSHLD